jgi:ABC-type transport system substrate-binding protein
MTGIAMRKRARRGASVIAVTFAGGPRVGAELHLPDHADPEVQHPTIGEFQYLMYRPLYYTPKGDQPVIDDALILADEPIYSRNNTVVTVNLKTNYQWSDGEPVDARDVVFFLKSLFLSHSHPLASICRYRVATLAQFKD